MSKESKNNPNNNEEIDLLVLFNFFGDKINGLFNLFKNFFGFILTIIVYISREILLNIKLISFIVIAAGIAGYFLESSKTKTYESKMLVRTYFEAKYQLATNIQIL